MKTSQVVRILLFVLHFWNISASSQLDEFLKSVKDAHSELEWLDNIPIPRRKRSATIEELLSRFEFGDDTEFHDTDLEGGDAWYQSFREQECRHGGCQKQTLRWKTKKAQPDDYYEYYEEAGDQAKPLDLKDQWEETQNDLSHEANYKLSKVEQDEVEKSLPKTAWPVRYGFKRSVDPMQEIKLKTSTRMIRNGDGPLLPSMMFEEDSQKISVEDILGDTKHEDSPDPWKDSYEVLESRKLLSIEDSDEEELVAKPSRSREYHALDMQQFDNMNQRNHLDRELAGLFFDNTDAEIGKDKSNDLKKGTLTSLSDELMHSAAFIRLQNFLRGKTNKTAKAKSDSKTTTHRPTPTVPLNLVDKEKNVNIKLHMSVNATVLGDSKLPEQFQKNNTITFKPPTGKTEKPKKENSMGPLDDVERDTRSIVFPLELGHKRKTNEDISKSVIEATESFPLDELITGKLTSQLVKTIFALVRSSPSLKVLWPGLKRNKVTSAKQVQNFYAIRTHDNESEMHRTELMLRQAMETINAIIEQQVRSRSCIPLRADLQAFYNLILSSKAENDRLQDRQKRETEADQPSSMSGTQIRKKSRIVKKLLKDYEELPREDQDEVVNHKESLLIAAEELRNLEQAERRRKRQIMENHLLNSNNTSAFEHREVETRLTPRYLKLARTAEMLLHNSLKDPDLSSNFNFI